MYNYLQFFVSKIYVINGVEQFNVHVEYTESDYTYHYADIYMPDCKIWDSMGFSMEELEHAATYCKSEKGRKKLWKMARKRGYGELSELLRDGYWGSAEALAHEM